MKAQMTTTMVRFYHQSSSSIIIIIMYNTWQIGYSTQDPGPAAVISPNCSSSTLSPRLIRLARASLCVCVTASPEPLPCYEPSHVRPTTAAQQPFVTQRSRPADSSVYLRVRVPACGMGISRYDTGAVTTGATPKGSLTTGARIHVPHACGSTSPGVLVNRGQAGCHSFMFLFRRPPRGNSGLISSGQSVSYRRLTPKLTSRGIPAWKI